MELTKSDNGKWKPGQSGNLQGRPVGTFVPRIGRNGSKSLAPLFAPILLGFAFHCWRIWVFDLHPMSRTAGANRAVTGFWLASLHDGKRGTGQISQGDASLYAPTLLERQCGCACAFATICTLGSARAGATTQNRYQRRRAGAQCQYSPCE
jgi:hypothetical protein